MAWVSLSRCSKPAKSSAGGAGGLVTGWVTAAACAAAGVPPCAAAAVPRFSAGIGLDVPPAGGPVPRGVLALALPAAFVSAGLAEGGAGDGAGGGDAADASAVACPPEEGCASCADRAGGSATG